MGTERIVNKSRRTAFAVACAALALAFALIGAVCAPPAFANQKMDAPTTVSDDVTRVHVSKLDADTHEYVQGAKMAIIEKDTGAIVDEWVTGKSVHENEKGLNVGTVYILRELEAPKGYDKVQDVEFKVRETEGEGIEIVSQGSDSELTESYKIALYDKAQPKEEEKVVKQTRPTPNTPGENTNVSQNTATTRAVAPKTGDETPLWLVGARVVVGLIAMGRVELPKRRMKDEE